MITDEEIETLRETLRRVKEDDPDDWNGMAARHLLRRMVTEDFIRGLLARLEAEQERANRAERLLGKSP